VPSGTGLAVLGVTATARHAVKHVLFVSLQPNGLSVLVGKDWVGAIPFQPNQGLIIFSHGRFLLQFGGS